LFTSLDADPNGWIVIGGKPVDMLSPTVPQPIEDGYWYYVGLQVWSGHQLGYLSTEDPPSPGGTYTFDYQSGDWPTALWESNWLDLGDPLIYKQILAIELLGIASGDNGIQLQYCFDHKPDWTTAGLVRQQMAEIDDSAVKDAVYGEAVIGTDTYAAGRLVGLRWDIPSTRCRFIKFKISTSSLLRISTFRIRYNVQTNRTPNMRERQ
jgi:hypothetical protein